MIKQNTSGRPTTLNENNTCDFKNSTHNTDLTIFANAKAESMACDCHFSFQKRHS